MTRAKQNATAWILSSLLVGLIVALFVAALLSCPTPTPTQVINLDGTPYEVEVEP